MKLNKEQRRRAVQLEDEMISAANIGDYAEEIIWLRDVVAKSEPCEVSAKEDAYAAMRNRNIAIGGSLAMPQGMRQELKPNAKELAARCAQRICLEAYSPNTIERSATFDIHVAAAIIEEELKR